MEGYLVIQWTHLDQNSGELGLYSASDFGNAARIEDYIQYNSANNQRATVAVGAGVWDDINQYVIINSTTCETVGGYK